MSDAVFTETDGVLSPSVCLRVVDGGIAVADRDDAAVVESVCGGDGHGNGEAVGDNGFLVVV